MNALTLKAVKQIVGQCDALISTIFVQLSQLSLLIHHIQRDKVFFSCGNQWLSIKTHLPNYLMKQHKNLYLQTP